MHPVTAEVTARIVERSRETRADYLARMEAARSAGPGRASSPAPTGPTPSPPSAPGQGSRCATRPRPTSPSSRAYNDMLSAHQPLERFPAIIQAAAREVGATAQFAGGVPAMCDGVTQGRPGMELSLFSRDVIAMATAVALTHDAFDAALMLGICDKIVPGLMIGALAFGHLPMIFVPAGPMTSGISNAEKARVRALYAEGKASREELLDCEMAAYHGPGTCTFYGTANSNQMLMEMMGLHLPGAAFVHPDTPLRDALTAAAPKRAVEIRDGANAYTPMAAGGRREGHGQRARRPAGHRRLDQPHPAPGRHGPRGRRPDHLGRLRRPVARHAADRAGLSQRLGRREPLPGRRRHGLRGPPAAGRRPGPRRRHDRRRARACAAIQTEPFLDGGKLVWREGRRRSLDRDILRPVDDPFQAEGGMRLLTGTLGRAVIKTSAVKPEHRVDRGAGHGVRRPGRPAGRLQARRARPATSSPWSASRAPRPTACRSCTT